MPVSYPKEVIKDLIERKLPWERVKWIISDHKDEDRFDKYVEILQEKVSWQEKILLPLTDELYIVEGDEEMENPAREKVPVELGGLFWVRVLDMEPAAAPAVSE